MPAISFVIPCYNHARLLGECLESLRQQTLPDWEAIVVDDASTTGDAAAVAASLRDSRIHCVRHASNRGLAAARNTGLARAAAPILWPVDADDLLPPDAAAVAVAAFVRRPGADIIYGDLETFGAVEELWAGRPFCGQTLCDYQGIAAGSPFRRRVFRTTGGYYEGPELRVGNEDWEFWVHAVQRGFQAVYVPALLYKYSVSGDSMTSRLAREQYRTHEFIAARHADWFAGRAADARERFLLVGFRSSIRAALRDGDTERTKALLRRLCALGLNDREFLNLYPRWSRRRLQASLTRRLAPLTRLVRQAS